MLRFNQYDIIIESTEKKNTASFFDLDDTLFDHGNNNLRVHVLDNNGRKVRTLSSSEFNTHKLPEGHKYDFHEFKSSDLFSKTAVPIKKMIEKLKASQKQGHKVAIVTARGDMDNQERFAHHMNKYGIDINNVHVHRAGNEKESKVPVAKANIIHNEILKHGYDNVHLYDDNEETINHFLKLKSKFPDNTFHGHRVQHFHETGNTEVNTTKV